MYFTTILCALWTEGTLLHLLEHLSQDCLSASLPSNSDGHSCVGRGDEFASVQDGLALHMRTSLCLYLLLGFLFCSMALDCEDL